MYVSNSWIHNSPRWNLDIWSEFTLIFYDFILQFLVSFSFNWDDISNTRYLKVCQFKYSYYTIHFLKKKYIVDVVVRWPLVEVRLKYTGLCKCTSWLLMCYMHMLLYENSYLQTDNKFLVLILYLLIYKIFLWDQEEKTKACCYNCYSSYCCCHKSPWCHKITILMPHNDPKVL